ncbi:putative copper chaperone SCO1/SenC [Helianthus annuus]|nr:putative copper chaperone SCO1/SenC [Helianthus annuus]KAJ0544088.1 putative copper chaperone SCO1/SenC [Helianthus annuus]KAJ0713006.1 putative copper chaperone SCO1/SenC [Helianthus annuus]KAJ0890269.1 putative copper chaperone SCO1/SenC [Helianthus annuus]
MMGLTGPVGVVRRMANEYRLFFKKAEEDGDDYLFESSHIYSLGHETRHGCGVTHI